MRAHLDAHPPVAAAGALVGRAQPIAGVADVLDRQRLEQRPTLESLADASLDRLVVVAALGDRLLEDGRVRRDADHALLAHQAIEFSGYELPAADVVEPDALGHLEELFRSALRHLLPPECRAHLGESCASITIRPSGSRRMATRCFQGMSCGSCWNVTPLALRSR